MFYLDDKFTQLSNDLLFYIPILSCFQVSSCASRDGHDEYAAFNQLITYSYSDGIAQGCGNPLAKEVMQTSHWIYQQKKFHVILMQSCWNSHSCEKILKKYVMGCILHEAIILSETYCFRENPDWHCPTWISHKEDIVNPLSEMIDKRLQAFIKHRLFMLIY